MGESGQCGADSAGKGAAAIGLGGAVGFSEAGTPTQEEVDGQTGKIVIELDRPPSPTPARKPQVPAANTVFVPENVQAGSTRFLLRLGGRTNAKKRIQVRVSCSAGRGDVRYCETVVRRHGKNKGTYLVVSRLARHVRITWSAPGNKQYYPYRQTKRYSIS